MDDPLVFVIDLRDGDDHTNGESREAPPVGESESISWVAVIDEAGAPTLHEIPPTHDMKYLNALARLIRFADGRGESVRLCAEKYGTRYERRLLFEGRLPTWSLGFPHDP